MVLSHCNVLYFRLNFNFNFNFLLFSISTSSSSSCSSTFTPPPPPPPLQPPPVYPPLFGPFKQAVGRRRIATFSPIIPYARSDSLSVQNLTFTPTRSGPTERSFCYFGLSLGSWIQHWLESGLLAGRLFLTGWLASRESRRNATRIISAPSNSTLFRPANELGSAKVRPFYSS